MVGRLLYTIPTLVRTSMDGGAGQMHLDVVVGLDTVYWGDTVPRLKRIEAIR